jgi:ABC-type multidrug transport system fused ATPase/permease subunit
MKELNLSSLRKVMIYVGQEPVLFNTPIKENMLFAKPDATDEEIESALKAANAWDFIEDKMGSQGIEAQACGQKQRIAIARALIRKPKVLLLEKATSALDADSEYMVQQALDAVLENQNLTQTVIVIAHRLSTIKDADEILCLNRGIVVERGTHEQLIEMNGYYKKLVNR